MSSDSDLALGGKELTKLRKERHARWHSQNIKTLNESGVPYETANYGESLLFREPGKPKVDFFPSTGRWRSEGKTYNGGARKFLRWWGKQ